MPDPIFMSDSAFINSYNTYLNYLNYMQNWANSLVSSGSTLKNDPSFNLGLNAQEAAAVNTAITAAQTFLQSVQPK